MPQAECDAISAGLLGDPLGFLRQNIVANFELPITGIPTSAERHLDFLVDGATTNGGVRYKISMESNPFAVDAPLPVSFLPWGRNAGYHIILEPNSGPPIMMTAALEGCAVGYRRAIDGGVKVSHYNIQGRTNHEGDASQADALGFMGLWNHINAPSYFYPTEGERNAGFERVAYVFGVRDGLRWKMYAQRVSHDGRTYAILGAAEF